MSKSSYTLANDPSSSPSYDPNPPTVAAFAPTSNSGYSATTKQRSTIIVHKKSPLLVATPPQITRALAHSHPFILILNKFVGLLSWSTGDAWESFLLVAAFWAGCLYGDQIVRYATPINGVFFLILGMWSRRFSPLSSTSKTGDKHQAKTSQRTAASTPQHKSLDEIVSTLTQFTSRCNILLEPFLNMTDFLSTQQTATSATTRPALTTLLIRIILVTPLWVILTLPPFYILDSQRTILAIGTIILTWHSKPAKVSRVILWRSVLVRRISKFITGLEINITAPSTSTTHTSANEVATKSKKRRPASSGVQFTFILYENQRRWIGLGWTTSLFTYERASWTDEHLNPAFPKDSFELPQVDGRRSRWRWVAGSTWQIEKSTAPKKSVTQDSKTIETVREGSGGWIYYDNKWNDARSEDGWGRYTRRRKWFRDAELVEITPSTDNSPAPTPSIQSDAEAESIVTAETEEEKLRRAREYAKNLHSSASEDTEKSSGDLAESVATIVPDQYAAMSAKTKNAPSGKNDDDTASTKTSTSVKRRSGWFGRTPGNSRSIDNGKTTTFEQEGSDRGAGSGSSIRTRDSSVSKSAKSISRSEMSNMSRSSRDGPEEDVVDRWRDSHQKTYGVGEDVYMSLG